MISCLTWSVHCCFLHLTPQKVSKLGSVKGQCLAFWVLCQLFGLLDKAERGDAAAVRIRVQVRRCQEFNVFLAGGDPSSPFQPSAVGRIFNLKIKVTGGRAGEMNGLTFTAWLIFIGLQFSAHKTTLNKALCVFLLKLNKGEHF